MLGSLNAALGHKPEAPLGPLKPWILEPSFYHSALNAELGSILLAFTAG